MNPINYPIMKDSGIDWIGKIPKHWNIGKLKNYVIKIGSGITPKGGNDIYVKNGIPLIRSQNVHFDGLHLDDVVYIPLSIHEQMKNSKVQKLDVLMNITGASLGRCTVVPGNLGEANVNQHVCIIRPRSMLNFRFLSFYLTSLPLQGFIYALQVGASREGLTYEDVGSLHILIPPTDEQKIISDFLELKTKQIDSVIRRNQELTEILREKLQATINQAITKGLDPSIPTKDSKIGWIGNISKGWVILKFLSVLEKKDKRNDDNIQRKMLSVSQYFGVIEKEYESNVLIRSKQESQRYFVVESNDLVVNVMWLHYRGLGVSSIEGIVSPDYHVYKINSKVIDPQFLNYLVRCDIYINEYAKHLRGIRPNSSRIPEHDFKRLPLLLPPLNEQIQISDFLNKENSNIYSLIKKIQFQNEQLQEYRQTLISTLVTGKFDLRQEILGQ